jgi:cell division protein FtsQ
MARKSSPTILQEELYPAPGQPEREFVDNARLVDLDAEDESPFLRGQKRVSARRGTLTKKTVSRLKWAVIIMFLLCLATVAGGAVYRYGERNWRFRINSSDDIVITGTHSVPHAQVMEVLGGDIGRNIFFIPLAERKAQLEKIPWVESASVMRFVPNRLAVEIHERTPIAFARLGSHISLIDAGGTLMELPVGKQKYSFPVIVGMNPGEPLSTRAARMRVYNELLRQLDSDGAHYSQDLSEVDISDPDDVKVLTNDSAGAVLVHLGASDFLSRYRIYVTHLQAWRQQFEKLDSVDLRYEHQIIVNPDEQTKAPQLTPAAARAAMNAGVKPAALIHVVPARPAPSVSPKAPISTAAKTTIPTTVPAANPAAKTGIGKATARPAKKFASKRYARRPPRRRSLAALKSAAKPSPAAKANGSQSVTKPHEPEAISAKPAKSSHTSAAGHAVAEKKKPSAAVARNSDQQDHP